jgi:cytochrome c oxidase subunit I+III
VLLVLLGYSLLHCGLGTLLMALQAWRVACGYVGATRPYEPKVLAPLWYYNLGVLWASYSAIVLFPMSWGAA